MLPLPPQTRPRGQGMRRPSRWGSSSVANFQSRSEPVSSRYEPGWWMRGSVSGPPASSTSTVTAASSLRRLATTLPAAPAPTTT